MSCECSIIHRVANQLNRYSFPYDEASIPINGVYLLFEEGELGHDGDRIVRVGTHNGDGNLRKRLKEHFLTENKDRSIFRKNVGRAILNDQSDPFLEHWNKSLTSRRSREKYAQVIDHKYQEEVEKGVSEAIRKTFSFCVLDRGVASEVERKYVESKLISTISLCPNCQSSERWLGRHCSVKKIAESGLWQVQHLYKEPFDSDSVRAITEQY